jgi:hypothetical protein
MSKTGNSETENWKAKKTQAWIPAPLIEQLPNKLLFEVSTYFSSVPVTSFSDLRFDLVPPFNAELRGSQWHELDFPTIMEGFCRNSFNPISTSAVGVERTKTLSTRLV